MIMAITTAPNEKSARIMAKQLVELKLVACVNIIPKTTSVYFWEGKIKIEKEVIMLIKTKQSKIKKLEEELLSIHPYDTPEFVTFNSEYTNRKFEAWIEKTCIG